MKINPSQISKAMKSKAQKASTTRPRKRASARMKWCCLRPDLSAGSEALRKRRCGHGKVEMLRKQMEEDSRVNPQELANKIVDDLLTRKRV